MNEAEKQELTNKLLELTLYDKNHSFNLFRSEQCHLVNRMGEIDYVIDLLEKKKIDYYWKLDMKAEAFYLLAMLDYLSKRNDLPKCTDYEEIRRYKLEKPVYPVDTELSEKLLETAFEKYNVDQLKMFRYASHDILS